MSRPRVPLLRRLPGLILPRMQQLDESICWIWTGHRNKWTPVVRLNGKRVGAKQAIYETMVRKLEPWERLKWACGHPVCVNPFHAHVVVIGGSSVEPEPELPPADETFSDEELSFDDLFDIIVTMDTRDPAKIAAKLDVPIDDVKAALSLHQAQRRAEAGDA